MLASPVVCSDETSVRVKGKNWWEWVFIGTLAVLHVIQPSRGKAVVTALFGAIRPEVWVSDMLGSQRGHGGLWQVLVYCCAIRWQYAIECGDTVFSAPFRWLPPRAIAIGCYARRSRTLLCSNISMTSTAGSTGLRDQAPQGEPGRKLHKAHRSTGGASVRLRDQLVGDDNVSSGTCVQA